MVVNNRLFLYFCKKIIMNTNIKINYNDTFGTVHSHDYYKGKSFHYAGEWTAGAHYFSDDYNVDFIVKGNCLLACAQSHYATSDNEPKDFIFDENGIAIGIASRYWDFVLSGTKGNTPKLKVEADGAWYVSYDYGTTWNLLTGAHFYNISPTGIPKSDLNIDVQNSLDKADTAIQSDKIQYGTTEYWTSKIGYVPPTGSIIIYSDYKTVVENNETKYIPGIKIGSGNGYVQDLMFVDDDLSSKLLNHINNTTMHVTSANKEFWNNKINIDNNFEVVNESLIFNRN